MTATSIKRSDVVVTGSGTVYLFRLLTQEARSWVDEHVSDDRQMFGDAVPVGHRYMVILANGMQHDGLIVSFEEVIP